MDRFLKGLGYVTRRWESFWHAGWSALLFTLLHSGVSSLLGIPVDWARSLVFALVFWIATLLLSRLYLVGVDHGLARDMHQYLDGAGPKEASEEAGVARVHKVAPWLRISFMRSGLKASINAALAPRSDVTVDAPESLRSMILLQDIETAVSSWYLPVQALVWALPAAGFLGTGWHMRQAIVTFVSRVANPDPDVGAAVRAAEMIAPVLSSIELICLALGFSILGHVAVSVVLQADIEGAREFKRLVLRIPRPEEEEYDGEDA